jgi:hypothetical protein
MTLKFIHATHNDLCPAIVEQSFGSCLCNPEIQEVTEEKMNQLIHQSRKDRREAQRQAEKAIRKMRKL